MRIIAASILFAFSSVIAKGSGVKCIPFNYRYNFCFEPWVSGTQAKTLAKQFNDSKYQNDILLKTYLEAGKRVFAFEFRDEGFLNEMSQLPSEFDEEAETLLMIKYAPFLLQAPSFYVLWKLGLKEGDKVSGEELKSMIEADPDVYAVNKLNCDLLLNFCDKKGRIMKRYDVKEYAKRESAGNIETEITYPEGHSPRDTIDLEEE